MATGDDLERDGADTGDQLIRIPLSLRSPQERYLEHKAESDLTSRSSVFRSIVERYATLATVPHPPARKVRSHIVVSAHALAMIDRLAVEWGVERSEVARRLIDRAHEDDPIVFS